MHVQLLPSLREAIQPPMTVEPIDIPMPPPRATSNDIRDLGLQLGGLMRDQGAATIEVLGKMFEAQEQRAAADRERDKIARRQSWWIIVLTGLLFLVTMGLFVQPVLLR